MLAPAGVLEVDEAQALDVPGDAHLVHVGGRKNQEAVAIDGERLTAESSAREHSKSTPLEIEAVDRRPPTAGADIEQRATRVEREVHQVDEVRLHL